MLLAGATGLVGGCVLARVADAVPVGRRAVGRAGEIVADFDALPRLPAAAVAVCALGTTMAKAGSEAAFRAVDEAAVLVFARAAQAAGVQRFIIVSAVGADAGSKVFYSRVKGEVETALAGLGFARLDILQPGLIIGARDERRPVEAFLQVVTPLLNPLLIAGLDRYGAIEADVVAGAAVALAEADAARAQPGVFRHQNREMKALAADARH
jgi:uncharacterized protein YbjT (DUF2867 family)